MDTQTTNLIIAVLLTLANIVTVIYLLWKQEEINTKHIQDLKNLETEELCRCYEMYRTFQKEIDRKDLKK